MTYYIYKATNKQYKQKSYIGCTRSIGSRIRQHLNASMSDNPVFHKAIIEYGVCSFTWEILETAEFADEAFALEQKYIKHFNTLYPNGYNATIGGAGAPALYGKKVVCLTLDGEYIKTYDTANATEHDGYNPTQVVRVCNNKNKSCMNHIFMYEEDYIRNGSRVYKKEKCTTKVIQCDLLGNKINEFSSVQFASESTGTSRTSISCCLTGTYKSANGFIWLYETDYPIKDIKKYMKQGKGTKVAQINKNTNKVVAIYKSFSDAGKSLGVSYKNIQKVADKLDKTAYGYKWKRL